MTTVPRLIAALALAGCAATDASPKAGRSSIPVDSVRHAPAVVTRDTSTLPDSVRRPQMPLVPVPSPLRGLYVNRWAAIGDRMWQLIDVAKRTEVNALVIDVKDDRGFVLYHSTVPLAKEIGADTVRPMSYRRMQAVLDSMRRAGILPIARIVVAKDPLLADHKREWAVKRRSDGTAWLDKNGRPWLDPTHPEVWRYAGDLAAEAVRMGFSEVQFDYVRFPDEDRIITEGAYANMNGRVRADVIHDQLALLRSLIRPLKVRMTIDVFGLTSTDTTDMGIGQRWERFVDQADVVLPMDYPSHFAPGTYKLANPNAHPYETIDHALKDAQRRSAGVTGAAKIIPWYQDFTLGPPHYNAEQVRKQIQAGYDNGVMEWILWNPRSDYNLDALKPKDQGKAGERG
jgi:hypothetical protein